MKIAADGADHTARELRARLASEFGLSDQERKELLPSGQQPVFTNRLAWARSHLRMAGLLEKTGRGTFRITDRGKQALATNPPVINLRFLQQYPEYLEARNKPKSDPLPVSADEEEQTPQERLEAAYETLRANLAKDLLTQLQASTPDFFERVVVELLVRMGYGGSRKDAGKAIGKSGDEGIDGIIKEDRLRAGHHLHPGEALAEHCQSTGNPEVCWRAPRTACKERHLHHHFGVFQRGHGVCDTHRQQDCPNRWGATGGVNDRSGRRSQPSC